jgi:hypothetical protein
MKFALIATIAAVSAIKVDVQKDCINPGEVQAIFNAIDTNDNGQVNREELVKALKAFARSRDYVPTDDDWKWVKETAYKDAGADKTLSEEEFGKWVNQFAAHFHIDGCQ